MISGASNDKNQVANGAATFPLAMTLCFLKKPYFLEKPNNFAGIVFLFFSPLLKTLEVSIVVNLIVDYIDLFR